MNKRAKIKGYIAQQCDIKEMALGYTNGYPNLVLIIFLVVLILGLITLIGLAVSCIA